MSRFREEHYATRAWKKAFANGTLNTIDSVETIERESRAKHFQESHRSAKAEVRARARAKKKQEAQAWPLEHTSGTQLTLIS